MATEKQLDHLDFLIKEYKNKYLSKKDCLELDESSTRIMINSFLSNVLGYLELEDIKTEARISDKYADYLIKLKNKKHFIVEVKSISLDLTEKHFRQALEYAANEGIDWILLTNARQFILYRVLFKKPIASKEVFSINLMEKTKRNTIRQIFLITKKSVEKNELEEYWNKFKALEPHRLCKIFYDKKIVSYIKRKLKTNNSINFSDEDLIESIHQILRNPLDDEKPQAPIE